MRKNDADAGSYLTHMKRLPDRDWFTAYGVCVVLEVSAATLDRMVKDRRFPSPDGAAGTRRLWSFATVADHCTKVLIRQQQELFRLMDDIERLEERRDKRSKGLILAAENEAALERLRRGQIETDNLDEEQSLRTGVYGDRRLSELRRAFPFIYPDTQVAGPESDSGLSDARRRWLSVWRRGES
jgi:hypothetical protein